MRKLSRTQGSCAMALCLLVPALGALAPPVGAKRPVCARDLATLSIPREAAFSPDAEWIAYVLETRDVEENERHHQIYLVARRDGEPEQLTQAEVSSRNPTWSPRGRYLSFHREDEDGRDQVWVLPMQGGEAFQLTESSLGIVAHAWSPDGRSVIVLEPEEKPGGVREYIEELKEKGQDTMVRGRSLPKMQFWSYPVPPGERKLVFSADPGVDEFTVSPDGDAIAFRSNGTGLEADAMDFDVYVARTSGGSLRRVTRRNGEESNIHWTHDGKGLVLTATQIDSLAFSQSEVFVLPLEGLLLAGEPIPFSRWVRWTDRFDRYIDALLWPRSSGDPYVIAHDGVSSRLAFVTSEGGADWVTDNDQIVRSGAISPDGRWMAVTAESKERPPRLLLVERDGDTKRVLHDPNKDRFEDVRAARQEVISWVSRDGTRVEGLIAYPWWDRAQPPYPLIVYLHGGPDWHIADRLAHSMQIMAGWGYLVLGPNYRGSTGYGNGFVTANLRDLGGGDFEDVMAGVQQLIESGLADPDRMAVMGGSYGGYLTNRILTKTRRFAAAVSEYGIFSLITDFSNSIYADWEKSFLREYYWENLQPYLKLSPAFEVDLITTPVLLLHGQEDSNTFIANSFEMYTALNRLGRTVEFHTFPREPHGFYEPRHMLEEMRLVQTWFDRHATGGAIWPPRYADLRGSGPERLPPSFVDMLRKTNGLPRLHRPGDTLRVESGVSLAGIVTDVDSPESYGGDKPDGRFLEVGVLVTNEGKGGTFELTTEDIALLEPSGKVYNPAGVPVKGPGGRSLLRSPGFSVNVSPQDDGSWTPIRMTFEIPEDRDALPLILGPLPPILISVGEAGP